MYDRSIADPEGFWGEVAEEFHWFKKWDRVRSTITTDARAPYRSSGSAEPQPMPVTIVWTGTSKPAETKQRLFGRE